MKDKSRTPHAALIRARRRALEKGFDFAYVGNLLDRDRQYTYYPECQNLVIERNHLASGRFDSENGACASCTPPITGVFENRRGDWLRERCPLSHNQ